MYRNLKYFMMAVVMGISTLAAQVPSITSQAQLDALLKTGEPLVLKFSASWCGPCRQFMPIFDQFAQGNPDIRCFSVDIDANRDIASNYKVRSIPMVLYFSNGALIHRESGMKTITQLKANVVKYCKR